MDDRVLRQFGRDRGGRVYTSRRFSPRNCERYARNQRPNPRDHLDRIILSRDLLGISDRRYGVATPERRGRCFSCIALTTYLIDVDGFQHIVAVSVEAFLLVATGQLGI